MEITSTGDNEEQGGIWCEDGLVNLKIVSICGGDDEHSVVRDPYEESPCVVDLARHDGLTEPDRDKPNIKKWEYSEPGPEECKVLYNLLDSHIDVEETTMAQIKKEINDNDIMDKTPVFPPVKLVKTSQMCKGKTIPKKFTKSSSQRKAQSSTSVSKSFTSTTKVKDDNYLSVNKLPLNLISSTSTDMNVTSKFCVGELVMAKMAGYPEWPAIVTWDSLGPEGKFIKTERVKNKKKKGSTMQTKYNVLFLSYQDQVAWLSESSLTKYTNKKVLKSQKNNGSKNKAIEEANSLKNMSCNERLAKYVELQKKKVSMMNKKTYEKKYPKLFMDAIVRVQRIITKKL